jgi:hypothetical protein
VAYRAVRTLPRGARDLEKGQPCGLTDSDDDARTVRLELIRHPFLRDPA